MKHLQYTDVERRLRAVFPALEVFAPTDKGFLTVDTGLIDKLTALYPARHYVTGINECEEIARRFCTQVADWQLDRLEYHPEDFPLDQRYSFALGEASGELFRGQAQDHTVNIFLTEDAVMLLDMQTGTYWPAKAGEDVIFFVRM